MVSVMTNDPKILVEFSPDEIKCLADLLYDRYWQFSAMKANHSDNVKNVEIAKKEMNVNNNVRNRLLGNASRQGFGEVL
jgi:hypothetical protein